MSLKSVFRLVFDVKNASVVGVEASCGRDGEPIIILDVRVKTRARNRCPECGKRRPLYDQGRGPRLWRSLDLGSVRCLVRAPAPRITCPDHGVLVAAVPWARPGAGFTRDFEDQVAWLATHTSKKAVAGVMRIAWRTVGSIIHRVVAEVDRTTNRLDGLVRIGIDEVAFRKGREYLTVVVDHDTGRLVWAYPGRTREVVGLFFDDLGVDRTSAITHVSSDGAPGSLRYSRNAARKRSA